MVACFLYRVFHLRSNKLGIQLLYSITYILFILGMILVGLNDFRGFTKSEYIYVLCKWGCIWMTKKTIARIFTNNLIIAVEIVECFTTYKSCILC